MEIGEMGFSYLLMFAVVAALSVAGLSENTQGFSRDDFPKSFVFGAGVSAYQAEGAAAQDGRTPSTWDTFTHAGLMPDKSTGDMAVDQYHKYKEDVQLVKDTGLEAYRLSISWSRLLPRIYAKVCSDLEALKMERRNKRPLIWAQGRIIPADGRGAVNPKGLEYYNCFINELIIHGIEPHITLFHFDFPQVLEDEYKGWLSPRIVDDFTAYADACFREFGDRVSHWTTINEPNIMAITSYDSGAFPPQRCTPSLGSHNCTAGNSSVEPYIAAHHVLLAHSSAVRLYKGKYQEKQKGQIGINLYCYWFIPYTNSTADVKATKRALDFYLGWIVNPLVFGDYPESMKENVGARLTSFTKCESELIKGSFDFLGLSHYTTAYVEDRTNDPVPDEREFNLDMFVKFRETKDDPPSVHLTPVYRLPGELIPSGLNSLLDYINQTYGNPPVYIHENGLGLLHKNESLNDTERVDYLKGYIYATLRAIRDGCNVKGYFVWSFLDVFEYLGGYKTRYGLYYVDFDDKELRRIPKLSAQWYSEFLKNSKEQKIEKISMIAVPLSKE